MSLHPTIQTVLNTHLIDAHKAKVTTYVSLLRTHDWQHEFGSHESWKIGHAQRLQLEALREEIDPDCEIWNEYAPESFRKVAA